LRRLPWQVAKKLLLYVFSVDEKGKVKKYDWQKLKKHQKQTLLNNISKHHLFNRVNLKIQKF